MVRRYYGRHRKGHHDPDDPLYNSLKHTAELNDNTPEDDFEKIFVVPEEEHFLIDDEEITVENATHALKDDVEYILIDGTWLPLNNEIEPEDEDQGFNETLEYQQNIPSSEQSGYNIWTIVIVFLAAGLAFGFFILPVISNETDNSNQKTSDSVLITEQETRQQNLQTIIPPLKTSDAIRTTVAPIEYFERSYHWTYGRHSPTFTINIPKPLYEYYQDQPHDRNYAKYAITSQDRKVLDRIISSFRENTDSKTEAAYNIVAFVQSLPYFKDDVSTGYDNYPRYPIETLVDNGGDCEDTAILTAALLKEMNYDVILVNPPGHMAVGITCSGCLGTSYTYNGKKYYYLETTGNNWKVGQMPEKYKNTKVKLYPI